MLNDERNLPAGSRHHWCWNCRSQYCPSLIGTRLVDHNLRDGKRGRWSLGLRPLEALYPVIYLDAIIVKVRDGGHVRNNAAHIAIGVDMTASNTCWASGGKPPRAPSSGRRSVRSLPTGAYATCSSCAARACQVFCVNGFRFLIDVAGEPVGVGHCECVECGFPALGLGAFDEFAGCFPFGPG